MNQLVIKFSIAALACLVATACSDGGPQIVQQAVAAPAEEATLYLPAQFPSVEGALEPHVEAF
jgi:hypothetical protein